MLNYRFVRFCNEQCMVLYIRSIHAWIFWKSHSWHLFYVHTIFHCVPVYMKRIIIFCVRLFGSQILRMIFLGVRQNKRFLSILGRRSYFRNQLAINRVWYFKALDNSLSLIHNKFLSHFSSNIKSNIKKSWLESLIGKR